MFGTVPCGVRGGTEHRREAYSPGASGIAAAFVNQHRCTALHFLCNFRIRIDAYILYGLGVRIHVPNIICREREAASCPDTGTAFLDRAFVAGWHVRVGTGGVSAALMALLASLHGTGVYGVVIPAGATDSAKRHAPPARLR